MTCTRPMIAYRSQAGPSANGRWPIVFNVKAGYQDMEVKIPCGQCIGCRLEHSRQWAIRCINEASLYEQNCFVTLTYDEATLPKDKSLDKKVIQKFMKRMRKRYDKKRIRYYLCGEYGHKNRRPHYHICIFGFEFADKYLYTIREGVKLYRSEELEKLWDYGYSTIGEVTWESAAYVARYIAEKITGERAKEYYGDLTPEFALMSRKPGIGKTWWDKWKNDVKNTDQVIVRGGLAIKPPIYYNNMWEIEDHPGYRKAKAERRSKTEEKDYEELRLLEKYHAANKKTLKRSL